MSLLSSLEITYEDLVHSEVECICGQLVKTEM